MEELFQWLTRLEALSQTVPPVFVERMHRVFVPSPLDFDGTVIRVVDSGQEASSFGRLPGKLAVLCWPDSNTSPSLGNQAVAAQLGAVFTFATNRRIEVAASDLAITPEGTEQRIFLPTNLVADRALAGPLGPDPENQITSVLESLYGLPSSDRESIGSAMELHYNAALLYDVDVNAAYALAVAGAERLSQAYGSQSVAWMDWEHSSRFDRVFDEVSLTETQADRLRAEILLERHLRLRQSFASYATETLPETFWDCPLDVFTPGLTRVPGGAAQFGGWVSGDPESIGKFVPSDRAVLRKRLLKSYDARSSYVHAGTRRDMISATVGQTVTEDSTVGPIEFVGIRAILRELIACELGARSVPSKLPPFIRTDGGHPQASAAPDTGSSATSDIPER